MQRRPVKGVLLHDRMWEKALFPGAQACDYATISYTGNSLLVAAFAILLGSAAWSSGVGTAQVDLVAVGIDSWCRLVGLGIV